MTQKSGASDDAKKTVNTTFKLRIRELEAEVRGLRNHIEVIQGIALQVPDLNQEIESLKAENLRLNVQLHELRVENLRLKEQLNTHPVSNSLEQSVASKSKVTPLADKRAIPSMISDKIKAQLAELKISLNSTLSKTIKFASEELVISAIEALKEAMVSGNVENPGGWLNKAITEGWMPSEKHLQKAERDVFNEWFNLAKKQGLIMASTKGDDGKLYVFTRDGVRFPFDVMLAEHPLDILRRSMEYSTL